MITLNSATLASSIVLPIVNRGAILGLKEGSPVSILNQGCDIISGLNRADDVPMAVRLASEDHGHTMTSHSTDLDNIASGMADRISGNIASLRTKINPLIKEIFEKAKTKESLINSDNPLNVNVIHVATPEIYDTESLDRFIELFRGQIFEDPGHREGLYRSLTADLTPEEFLEMTKESSELFNNSVATLVSEVIAGTGSLPLFERTPLQGIELYNNYGTVLTYIFLRAISAGKHPRANLSEMPNEDRMHVQRLLGFYGKNTGILIEALNGDLEEPNMVFFDVTTKRELYVNDSKYQRYLKEGGTIEAAIGYTAARAKQEASKPFSIANVSFYEDYHTYLASVWGGHSQALTGMQVENLVEDELVNYLVETIADSNSRMDHIKDVREHFTLEANRMYSGMEIHDYIVRSVCLTIGKHIDAFLIHTEMKTFMDLDDTNTIDQAAIYAVTRLVARWVASQYELEERGSFATPSTSIVRK